MEGCPCCLRKCPIVGCGTESERERLKGTSESRSQGPSGPPSGTGGSHEPEGEPKPGPSRPQGQSGSSASGGSLGPGQSVSQRAHGVTSLEPPPAKLVPAVTLVPNKRTPKDKRSRSQSIAAYNKHFRRKGICTSAGCNRPREWPVSSCK